MEMEKVYNPQAIENDLYREWEESGAFIAFCGISPKTVTSRSKSFAESFIGLPSRMLAKRLIGNFLSIFENGASPPLSFLSASERTPSIERSIFFT